MNTTTNPTTAISSTPKRIILVSAYRHERHTTGRQERSLKTLRKLGRFDDNEMRRKFYSITTITHLHPSVIQNWTHLG